MADPPQLGEPWGPHESRCDSTARRYLRIDFSTGLPNWFYLSVVSGDGNVAMVQTPSVPSGVRYYRVIELP